MRTTTLASFVLWPAFVLSAAGAATSTPTTQPRSFEALTGHLLLDNNRVYVEKFNLQPGQSTGRHVHPSDQLLIFIKGGVLTAKSTGRATLWRDGRVAWQEAAAPADEGSINSGSTPIEMVLVTLKPVATASANSDHEPKYRYLNYPNIPGEDLLENDSVIVQRFVVNPGQWEGVHAHHPDMLYIHIKGGQWAARSKNHPPQPYPEASADGSVGWMPTIDISEEHQSGNVGSNPIDLIWVTLKN
jgi:quercetin dioxygenase-like cupin family protein